MTEARPVRRPQRKGAPVVWLSISAFLVVLAFLALRLSGGDDPALGAGQTATVQPRRVLVRRVIQRRVVIRVIPRPQVAAASQGAVPATAPSAPASAPASTPAASGTSSPAPAQSAPAPVAAAPAPAAPPAPAPAPAPVTRSS